jgi:hypothetical protein
MSAIAKQSVLELIEEFRSTGYSGREPAIASAPLPMGTCATALRQLEVMATHIAAAWLEGDMNETEFLQFVKDCLLTDTFVLANIVEEAFRATPRFPFGAAWFGTQRLIQEFSIARPGCKCGDIAVSFLIATMVLRQLAEHELAPTGKDRMFRPCSTNVAPEFFDRCIHVLGRRPFGAREGAPLTDLEKQLEELSCNPLAADVARQRIA